MRDEREMIISTYIPLVPQVDNILYHRLYERVVIGLHRNSGHWCYFGLGPKIVYICVLMNCNLYAMDKFVLVGPVQYTIRYI